MKKEEQTNNPNFSKYFHKRKGSVLDIFIVILFISTMSIALISMQSIWGNVSLAMNSAYNQTLTAPNLARLQYVNTQVDTGLGIAVDGIILIAMGIAGSAFILAFALRSHPIFIPFVVISAIVIIISAGFVANATYGILTAEFLRDTSNEHVLLLNVVRYLPFLVTILLGFMIVIMHSPSSFLGKGRP